MTTSIQVVAHAILQKNKAEGRKTTPLQIIKLAYLAHGWHLAFFGKPLFKEDVRAWPYGPVIPQLYRKVKDFGKEPINADLFSEMAEGIAISDDEQHVIDEVIRVYGEYEGVKLSGMTHKKGTPWDNTAQGDIISNDLIKDHFNKIMKQG